MNKIYAKPFPADLFNIDFHRDDSIKYAVDDDLRDVDTDNVSSQSVKICYQTIAKLSQDGFFCNVSQKKISKVSGLSLRTVVAAIKVLKKSGRLYVEHKYTCNNQGQRRRITSNMWMVRFGRWVKRKLDKAMELGQKLKQGISADSAPLFNVNKRTGEILSSGWLFISNFCQRTTLQVFEPLAEPNWEDLS